ncbi:MAG: hypothetical protein KAW12_07480 [Candidatus Aminicenantes bacterium]|nr:hypothetical protein [Candidatus Aminicenantes bacterium]
MNMIEKIEKNVKRFYIWSIINPITFYRSVNNELGSKGYNEYLRFYKDCMDKQKGFLRFYYDNKLKGNPKVVSFLKDGDFIFYAKPSLPAYFGLGLVVQLFWIVLLFAGGYILFSRSIYPKPVSAKAFKGFKTIDIPAGKLAVFNSIDDKGGIADQVYNALSGKCEKNFIKINGVEPAGDFFYIPNRSNIPAGMLPETEVKAIEYAAEKSKTIVLDGFITSYKCDEVNRKIEELKAKGYVFIMLDLRQQVREIEYCVSFTVKDKAYQIEQLGKEKIELKDA